MKFACFTSPSHNSPACEHDVVNEGRVIMVYDINIVNGIQNLESIGEINYE
jgi:hypothetical protein